MIRDFSDRAKEELLKIVTDVQNDKQFVVWDWFNDRYMDFQAYIGKLNIRNYLNNVNEYHRKVIDQNNTTKAAIEKIFQEVKLTDSSYAGRIGVNYFKLENEIQYIQGLSQIVHPSNGKHMSTADFINSAVDLMATIYGLDDETTKPLLYSTVTMNVLPLLKTTTSADSATDVLNVALKGFLFPKEEGEDAFDFELLSNLIGTGQEGADVIGELSDIEGFSFISTILKYLKTLTGLADDVPDEGVDVVPDFLSIIKASLDVEKGVYDYYVSRTDSIYDIAKLGEKYGNLMTGIGITAKGIDLTKDIYETYKIFSDEDSKNYDKASKSIKTVGSFIGTLGKIYIAAKSNCKELRFVSEIAGAKGNKAVNQILVTSNELKYTVAPEVKKATGKISTALSLIDVGVETTAATVKRIGQVAEDGNIDGLDQCSIAVYGSLGGLDAVAKGLTCGVISIDSEKVAGELEAGVDTFLQGDSWASNYIKDPTKPEWARVLVSIGAAGDMVAKKTVEIVTDKAEEIGGWIETGWETGVKLIRGE